MLQCFAGAQLVLQQQSLITYSLFLFMVQLILYFSQILLQQVLLPRSITIPTIVGHLKASKTIRAQGSSTYSISPFGGLFQPQLFKP